MARACNLEHELDYTMSQEEGQQWHAQDTTGTFAQPYESTYELLPQSDMTWQTTALTQDATYDDQSTLNQWDYRESSQQFNPTDLAPIGGSSQMGWPTGFTVLPSAAWHQPTPEQHGIFIPEPSYQQSYGRSSVSIHTPSTASIDHGQASRSESRHRSIGQATPESWEIIDPISSPSNLSEQLVDSYVAIGSIPSERPSGTQVSDVSDIAPASVASIAQPEVKLYGQLVSSTEPSSQHLDSKTHVPKERKFVQHAGDPRYRRQRGPLNKTRKDKAANDKKERHLTEEGRKNAALRRKYNDRCLRCKVYKLRCDPGKEDPLGRCQCCVKSGNNPRSFLEPCNRDDLKNIQLARNSSGLFAQHEVEFVKYVWRDPHQSARELTIRWSLPDSSPITVMQFTGLPCREFVPDSNGAVETTAWEINYNGNVKRFALPPLALIALSDDDRLVGAVREFLNQSQPAVEDWIARNTQNELHRATFIEAQRLRQAHNSSILSLAFKLRCGAVVSQGYGTIKEYEGLGREDPDNLRTAYGGFDGVDLGARVPPAIDHQFDVAILQYINALQDDLLKQLQKKIISSDSKTKPWYEVFLACFVLLSGLEYIEDGARRYVESSRQTTVESQVSHVVKRQLEKWQTSAELLLQHFRVILRGQLPFELARDNMSELRERANLDDTAVNFMTNITRMLRSPPALLYNRVTNAGHTQSKTGRGWVEQLYMPQAVMA